MSTPLNHIAISPDGNRRWAAERGSGPAEGYDRSLTNLPGIIEATLDNHIPYLTLHAMNSRSWARPGSELAAVFSVVGAFARSLTDKVESGDVSFVWVGRRGHIPADLADTLTGLENDSQDNPRLHVAMYLDFDENEHLAAARGSRDNLEPAGFPDVDLYIRTSSDFRTSGFDPLRLAFAELAFVPGGFPSFTGESLNDCIVEYETRNRTFGS